MTYNNYYFFTSIDTISDSISDKKNSLKSLCKSKIVKNSLYRFY